MASLHQSSDSFIVHCMIAINLPPEFELKLASYAVTLGQSEAVLAKQAVIDFIEEMEDIALVEARIAENNPRISLQEMRERLGLDD
jgi:RHH-type rel operon transcriptional repressor/antitoxin RelB